MEGQISYFLSNIQCRSYSVANGLATNAPPIITVQHLNANANDLTAVAYFSVSHATSCNNDYLTYLRSTKY